MWYNVIEGVGERQGDKMTRKRKRYEGNDTEWEQHLRKLTLYRCTVEWSELRERVLERDGHECQDSNCKGLHGEFLEVHHLTYRNVFKEPLEDMATVCKDCHKRIHYDEYGRRRQNWKEFQKGGLGECHIKTQKDTGKLPL